MKIALLIAGEVATGCSIEARAIFMRVEGLSF